MLRYVYSFLKKGHKFIISILLYGLFILDFFSKSLSFDQNSYPKILSWSVSKEGGKILQNLDSKGVQTTKNTIVCFRKLILDSETLLIINSCIDSDTIINIKFHLLLSSQIPY